MKSIKRPKPEDAPNWCQYYWNLVKEDDLMEAFQNNLEFVLNLVATIPHSKHDYTYDPDKWTVKGIFIHLVDCERYFSYRAFSTSRKVAVNLVFDGFQDDYVRNSNISDLSLLDIAEEWETMRNSTMLLFENMTDEMLDFRFPDKTAFTARSMGWLIAGHTVHHCKILEEKYLTH